MTYDDFIEFCKKFAPHELRELGLPKDNYSSWQHTWNGDRTKYKEKKFVLEVRWETGGVSGGSCWDSSDPTPYTSSNKAEDFTELDIILEQINPNISFLQYKNMYNSCVVHETKIEYEYYGNRTDYAIKRIELKKLYDYIKEKGWLKQP